MIKEKYIERLRETSINIASNTLESIRKKDITKTGLRVYKDGKLGIAGALGSYNERELQERALKNLIIPYDYEVSRGLKRTIDNSKEILSSEEFVHEVEELLRIISHKHKGFGIYNKIKLINKETSLENTEGLELISRDSYVNMELMFSDKAIAGLEGFFWVLENRKYNRSNILEDIDELCNAYNNLLPIRKKSYMPVIFMEWDSMPYLKFMTDLNGNKLGSGASIFSGELGKKKFSDSFNLYSTRNPQEVKVPFFDGEGTVNEDYRYNLIEKGVIVSPFTDKRTAKKYGYALTGAAECEFDGPPTLTAPPMKIGVSNKTLKELVAGEEAIIALMAQGGDYTQEGGFATPVQVPLLFDGERIIGRLPALQVSSKIYNMFGEDFRGVSKDYMIPSCENRALVIDMNISSL